MPSASRCFALVLSCLGVGLLSPLRGAELLSQPLAPPEALQSFAVRDGFRVELAAAEPEVLDPVAFDFGPDGKLWVVEMGDYPLGTDGKGKFGGRVRFLEDRDADGRYETSTVFLDGLGYPNGVIPYRKGVLVSCSPDILYAEDSDGDGRADVKQPLYTGFPAANQQHRMNGFWRGLDNWLYVADATGKIKSTRTGAELDVGRRDLRIRPDQGRMEPATGQSQFGRTRDDWDNWFGCGNSEPAYHFALADEYLRKNPYYAPPELKVQISTAPGAAPVFPTSKTAARFNDHNKANRFTSACGLSIYRDVLLGEEFLGNTFVSEPVHNLVHREVVSRQGATFASRRAPGEESAEFFSSSDPWFRPTMTRTGPDGALYVADMYRMVIEHPEWIPKEWQARLDLRAGHDRGRIYRIVPVGKKPRSVPRFDRLKTEELVAVLESPNGPQRDLAQQQLIDRGGREAVPPLIALTREGKSATARVHALCTLDGLEALEDDALARLLSDPHPGVRRHAIRLSEPRLPRSAVLAERVLALGEDPAAEVRVQRVATLGTWSDPRAGAAIGRVLAEPILDGRRDRFLEAAALAASLGNLEAAVDAAGAGPASEPLFGMALGSRNERAAARLIERAASALRSPEPAARRQAIESVAVMLDALDRQGTSLARFREGAQPPLAEALDRLAPLFEQARASAIDSKQPAADRLLALRVMGRGPVRDEADQGALAGLLAPQHPPELQLAAAAALARLRDAKTPERLLAGWKAHGPRLRAEILNLLMTRREWLPVILGQLEAKTIAAADLDASARARLLEHKDDEIRARAAKLLAANSNVDRQRVLADHEAVLTTTGDATRGAELFAKKCGVCHQIGGKGHAIGPDLTALTDKSPQAMLTAILDPNRAVETRYISYAAVTAEGLTYTGLLAAETGGAITLLGAEGKSQTILRVDLEELQASGKSLMPEGLEKDLRPQELADVIAFVRSSGPARKQFPGNTPETIRPEALRGELYLLARQGEIFGTTLVFEPKYGNVGYWQSENDSIIWTIDVPEPGEYVASLDYACAEAAAGQTLLLETGGQRLSGRVKSTGSWDAYGRLELGRVKLAKGEQRVGVRAAGKLAGPLLDLKSIGLRPAK